MLSRDLARVAAAGRACTWSPVKGDRFVVPDRDLDDEVFVVSDMVVEAVDLPRVGRILAFNGTTEWALDSLEAAEAIWLPREEQLRDAARRRVRLPRAARHRAAGVRRHGARRRASASATSTWTPRRRSPGPCCGLLTGESP